MLTRQLTWIRLFDFEVRHVKGATHIAADFFSKRLRYLKDIKSDIAKENNNEDWILIELEAYKLCLIEAIEEKENEAFTNLKLEKQSDIFKKMKERVQRLQKNKEILISSSDTESNKENPRTLPIFFKDYSKNFLRIAEYVITIKTLKGMNKKDFRKFK